MNDRKGVTRNERGVALIMALVLAFIGLIVGTAVVYMVTQGTKMSGIERRYSTALGAAKGGVEIAASIINQVGENPDSAFITIPCPALIQEKIVDPTAEWDPTLVGTCPEAYDAYIKFEHDPGGGRPLQQYDVTITVVDTTEGNSKKARDLLEEGSGVVDNEPIQPTALMPNLYRVEVHSERPNPADPANPFDVADMVMLYAR